jgi:hypothetical protein
MAELVCDEVASTLFVDMLVPSWWQSRAFDRFNQGGRSEGAPSNSSFSFIEGDSWVGCQQLTRSSGVELSGHRIHDLFNVAISLLVVPQNGNSP